ncbi:zinc finger MYM-type protein 1-like protein [Cinnamomum micranthum f. kanehirae]|uniref:Zinc finger MYM-type protein 1-like protein n=1 Tax=Cinnamomum micranthum f. kanehirae TaxID=337451 RepID=A0A443PSD1_9MAGN|nr:zinc finger MYM-type protein 1-like protein [Cinnamomum micranthum f. kanehirae]
MSQVRQIFSVKVKERVRVYERTAKLVKETESMAPASSTSISEHPEVRLYSFLSLSIKYEYKLDCLILPREGKREKRDFIVRSLYESAAQVSYGNQLKTGAVGNSFRFKIALRPVYSSSDLVTYFLPSRLRRFRIQSHEVNLTNLPAAPGLRNPISSSHPMDRYQVQRAYLQKGPCQPRDHKFPYTRCGEDKRRFNPFLFKDYDSWLEYSIEKDAAFCMCCYLFGEETRYDAFITQGFKKRIENHVGGPNGVHNQAYEKYQNLLNQKQHIETIIIKQSSQVQTDYRICLKATLAAVRFLLRQGLPFHGHDKSEYSNNMGNFLELLQVLANHNEAIKRVVDTPIINYNDVNKKWARTPISIEVAELKLAAFTLNLKIKTVFGTPRLG